MDSFVHPPLMGLWERRGARGARGARGVELWTPARSVDPRSDRALWEAPLQQLTPRVRLCLGRPAPPPADADDGRLVFRPWSDWADRLFGSDALDAASSSSSGSSGGGGGGGVHPRLREAWCALWWQQPRVQREVGAQWMVGYCAADQCLRGRYLVRRGPSLSVWPTPALQTVRLRARGALAGEAAPGAAVRVLFLPTGEGVRWEGEVCHLEHLDRGRVLVLSE